MLVHAEKCDVHLSTHDEVELAQHSSCTFLHLPSTAVDDWLFRAEQYNAVQYASLAASRHAHHLVA
jgi:hypothetical protein